jgi:hypothetical protein
MDQQLAEVDAIGKDTGRKSKEKPRKRGRYLHQDTTNGPG